MEKGSEFQPAVVSAVHDVLHNAAQKVADWAQEHTSIKSVAAVTLAGGLALSGCAHKSNQESAPGTSSTTTTSEVEACKDTWPIVHANAEDTHRFTAEGIPAIKAAQEGSSQDAMNGLNQWFDLVKQDPELLAGTTNAIMGENVTVADLTDANGICVSPRAKELSTKFIASVSFAGDKAPTVTQVPADGLNTGTDANGNVVVAEHSGITGDRKGIKVNISTPDGEKTFYVLARCGNPVLTPGSNPELPKGPTDQIPMKHDDGKLPGNPGVPADQDPGTPDNPGTGPAGQTPGPDGYLPQEPRPTAPPTSEATIPPVTQNTTPATTSPQPTSTQPPVHVTTPPTTSPQTGMPTLP